MENMINAKDQKLWIGLDSYGEEDSNIFFGRDEEAQTLASDILHNVQTVVYGQSGTGKTSLIRAGVFELVRKNRMLPVYIRLKYDEGDLANYVKQVTDAIEVEAKLQNIDIEHSCPYITTKNGKEECQSLWEFFHCNEFWNAENFPVTPLVVLDQFEEIFTLCKDRKQQDAFFEQLSDLCDDKYPAYIRDYVNDRNNERIEYADGINYRLVLSLREDFLARLEEKAENIPALKRNRFSLRCTNEEQALDIIMKPNPEIVTEEVAIQIIERVTNKKYGIDFTLHDEPDIEVEPSILSLFCSELDKKRRERAMDHISSELIGEFGDNIIKDFYLESIKNLSDEKVEFLENRLLTFDGFRDAVALQNAKRAGFTEEEIESLTKKRIIRKDEWDGAVRLEFTHDVLCKVALAHRTEQRKEKMRLQQEERERSEAEIRKQEEEKERLLLRQQRERRRFRLYLAMAVAVIAMIAGCVAYYYWRNVMEFDGYYAEIEYVDGWPQGVGEELSEAQRAHTPLYYRLSHNGSKVEHHTKIEVKSSNHKLPIATSRLSRYEMCENPEGDANGKAYNKLLEEVVTVQYEEGQNGKVEREVMKDKNGTVLFLVSYFYTGEKSAIAQFMLSNGNSLAIRDNMIDRMKILWDSTGMVRSLKYYDYEGATLPIEGSLNDGGICGFSWKRLGGNRTICYHLDQLGLPVQKLNNKAVNYNAVETYRNGDTTDVKYYKEFDVDDALTHTATDDDGFSRRRTVAGTTYCYKDNRKDWSARIVRAKDSRGNDTTILVEGEVPADMPAKIKRRYQPSTGYLIMEEKLDKNGQPFGQQANYIYKKMWNYDSCDRLTKEEYFTKDGRKAYGFTATYADDREEKETFNLFSECRYLKEIDSIAPGRKVIAFYGENGTLANSKISVGKADWNDSIECHRAVIETTNGPTTIVSRFYVRDSISGKEVPAPTKKDSYGRAMSYFKRVETRDENGNVTTLKLMDVQGNIIKSMQYIIRDGVTIGRGVMGIDGDFVRCPEWEEDGYAYYKFFITRKYGDNSITGLRAYNEFNQYSSFYDEAGRVYYKVINEVYGRDKEIYYEIFSYNEKGVDYCVPLSGEHSQYEMSPDSQVDTQSDIPFLHILSHDSPFHKAKLKDNDRLMRVGAWVYGMSAEALNKEWQRLNNEKRMVAVKVLRPVVAEKRFEPYGCSVQTDGKDVKAEYHSLCLTQDEEKTWKRYCRN